VSNRDDPQAPARPPMTLGNMRKLLLQAEFKKGNDHQSEYQQHCQFEPK